MISTHPNAGRSRCPKIIDKMRKATNVGALEGDVGTPTPGADNLIALKMTFDYPDPVKAQEVLQSYVTSFLQDGQ